MDVYGSDRKLSELGDNDFHDILDHDVFNTPCTGSMEYNMDSDWLDNFFDDPVLNDRMMSDALQPPNVQSEHSYSMTNSDQECDSPLNLTKDSADKELDTEYIATSCTSTPVTTTGLTQTTLIKQEPMDTELQSCAQMNTTTPCTASQTVLKQPTIILATTTQTTPLSQTLRQERLVLPKVNIKLEPTDNISYSSDPGVLESMTLPPTPPSSTNSDSEGSQSPQRSAPASPSRDHIHMRSQTSHYTQNQPLFTSPIPQSGVLILSEEEKRTLISEGYPIPGKLPLTKQEEKNLKKIRRKIKNKISAQESRRKKKEYLDTLEKRVESYSHENTDLKKKIDQLENSNRSLLSQLQRLQNLVSKVPRPSSATSTQTGTCLMVLVLCFAVFMGGWSPASFSIGYSKNVNSPAKNSVVDRVYIGPEPMGPQVKDARVDAYATPNMRSRVLLSIKEDGEDEYGPHTPFSYRDMFTKLFRGIVEDTSAADAVVMEPPLPQAQVMAHAIEADQQNQSEKVIKASIPIDLAANITAKVMTSVDKNRNTTA